MNSRKSQGWSILSSLQGCLYYCYILMLKLESSMILYKGMNYIPYFHLIPVPNNFLAINNK